MFVYLIWSNAAVLKDMPDEMHHNIDSYKRMPNVTLGLLKLATLVTYTQNSNWDIVIEGVYNEYNYKWY